MILAILRWCFGKKCPQVGTKNFDVSDEPNVLWRVRMAAGDISMESSMQFLVWSLPTVYGFVWCFHHHDLVYPMYTWCADGNDGNIRIWCGGATYSLQLGTWIRKDHRYYRQIPWRGMILVVIDSRFFWAKFLDLITLTTLRPIVGAAKITWRFPKMGILKTIGFSAKIVYWLG